MIDALQAEFGIPGSVEIFCGEGGLPAVRFSHASGAGAVVYLHGGHVTSWTNSRGEELFFVSRKSYFEPKRPIRGGIPVIFPQFGGNGPLPSHGIARLFDWKLMKTELLDSGEVLAELGLDSSDETRSLWPHEFSLRISLLLGRDALGVSMGVDNTGDSSFAFQSVFHTYFAVGDIKKTSVAGLLGATFIDSLNGRARSVEDRAEVRFAEETDRIYVSVPDTVSIGDEGCGRRISLEKERMPDVVVWNPWIEKSQEMADFGDDEYLRMVCVETGSIDAPVELPSGARWSCRTNFSCRDI